tara:strand:+ start:1041 stop:1994 length:954 start_codon:yes stop_codon:yes gene_type:complete
MSYFNKKNKISIKEIHIVGSGFKGLKLASLLSYKKNFKIYLYTNCNWFIFTPYIVSMINKKKFFYTSVDKFCEQRNIQIRNINVIDIENNYIKTAYKDIKVKGKIIDCRNNTRKLLNPYLKCDYYELGNDILKIINSNKKNIVQGHNIHSFEIAVSLQENKKLLQVKSNKTFLGHPLIKSIKKTKEINEIFKNFRIEKSIQTNLAAYNIKLPKNAQQASIEAKYIASKELGFLPHRFKNYKKSRGTMIKTSRRGAYIFLLNSKKTFIKGILGEFIRKIYYYYVYKTFFKEKENKLFLFFYFVYLRLWNICIKIKGIK